jgi:formylglycine-generating enzyme required for sulfatase activity
MKNITIAALLFISFCFINANLPPKPTFSLPKSWIKIPAGKVWVNNEAKEVGEFYILETEVSNLNYLEFLSDFKKNSSTEQYQKALPDTTKWLSEGMILKEYANQYFRYPGFRLFPVTCVNYQAANLYCEWLSNKLNERFSTNKIKVKLPSEMEWTRAARSDSQADFSIGNKSRNAGMNYKKDESEGKIKIITMDIYSFAPNKFGVFNMSGNVAEMLETEGICKGGSWNSTKDFVRIDAKENYPQSSIFVGFRPVLIINE